jgi:hypothetical protein
VIALFVHKADPTDLELISFQQCFRILGHYPIKVIVPKGLNVNKYQAVVSDFSTLEIDPKWQKSVLNYNKLKLSYYFYDLFQEYEFLLTYELDAFVFKDDLKFWCEKAYDYIGAPWFEGYDKPKTKLIGVGNSGFSLRNIKSVKDAIKKIYYKDPSEIYAGRLKKLQIGLLKRPYGYIKSKLGENYSIQHATGIHEDMVISQIIPLKCYPFNIAPVEDAIAFSFEVNPSVLYKLNNEQLPMGCHAWWRYDIDFWRPFIEREGYKFK